MKWTDTIRIAEALHDKFPDIDPLTVRFTDLHKWVCELDEFDDEPSRSGEKILEAIQMAWIEVRPWTSTDRPLPAPGRPSSRRVAANTGRCAPGHRPSVRAPDTRWCR